MSLKAHLRILRGAAGYDIGRPPTELERWDRTMRKLADAPTFFQVERTEDDERTDGMKVTE